MGGRYNIGHSSNRESTEPLGDDCRCPTCQRYTRAYLHHLFRTKEMLGMRAATLHNLHFTLELVAGIRDAIRNDDFPRFKRETLARLEGGG